MYELYLLILFTAAILGTICVGLVGTGSTVVLLPTLTIVLPCIVDKSVSLKMAIATTLATTAIVAITTSIHNIRSAWVDYSIAIKMLSIYIVTAFTGVILVHGLSDHTIKVVVAAILIFVIVNAVFSQELLSKQKRKLPILQLIFVFFIAGWVNSISGVGTGNIAIPFLNRNLDQRVAKGTSVFAAAVACSCGAMFYINAGWGVRVLPSYSAGYVYLPGFLVMVLAVFIARPITKRLDRKIKLHWLRYLLYFMVLVTAAHLLFQS